MPLPDGDADLRAQRSTDGLGDGWFRLDCAELTGGLEMHPLAGDGAWMPTWRSPSPRGWDVRLSDRSAAQRATGGGPLPVLPARDRVQTGALVVPVGVGP